MACSAYISYQLGDGSDAPGTTIQVTSRPRIAKVDPDSSPPENKAKSTSFVLVDPSTSSSKAYGVNTRKSIRKHASKACAAQRLATIAAKKKSRNVQTKRERQRQQAAERLEAALQQHAQKIASSESTHIEIPLRQLSPRAPVDKNNNHETTLHSEGAPGAGPGDHDTSSAETNQKRCNISDILTTTVPISPPAKEQSHADASPDGADSHVHPSSIVKMHTGRLDPFSTFPVDVQDDGMLGTLFSFLDTSVFPMMDLRLPMKFDRIAGTRHAHSKELPHFVLSSEPLFWTMALCAATIFTLRNRQRPGAEPITMGYRYMAIRSINQRLNFLGEDSIYDVGLIYAIASLGVWEREKGSKEVWHSHCQGIEMLCQKLRRASQHHLLAYIISCCHTAGSVPLEYKVGEGFRRLEESSSLDPSLISGIYECAQLDKLSPSPSATEQIQRTASKLLSFRPSDALPKTLCGNQARGIEGDRRNLEMHVLLQAAGASLISWIGKDQALQGIDMVDFDEMCREAVGLAKSVFHEPSYDELLLWATYTIFALNRYIETEGLQVVGKLARKLGLMKWQRLKNSLRLFVYLDSLDPMYTDYWAVVEQYVQ